MMRGKTANLAISSSTALAHLGVAIVKARAGMVASLDLLHSNYMSIDLAQRVNASG